MLNFLPSGYLFVNKSPGLTSSDIVIRLRKKLKLVSIGHTGTLDKFAEGLLILPYGDYTAFSQLFLGESKTYFAEVTLGRRTDSGDPDGEIEENLAPNELKVKLTNLGWCEQFLETELQWLTKQSKQKAPKISALKVGGSRQSDLVRSGETVVEKERDITIERVWDISFKENCFSFRIHVSSGTYIRKIILDLSDKWGIPLLLSRLIRESIGPWNLVLAKPIEEISLENGLPWQKVLSLPFRYLDPVEQKVVIHGGYIWDHLPEAKETGFYFLEPVTERIIAWCQFSGKKDALPYRYGKVFFNPSQKIRFSN